VLAGKTVTLVAAMAQNRAIGLAGAMPWHLPRELKHFKETTMGRPIVMGRKTWESIGRVLPGRQNIVVTGNTAYRADGCDVVHSLEDAARVARGDEIMIIGGGRIYADALPFADRMILTRVDFEPEADTWFPEWDEEEWTETNSRRESADDANPYRYRVVELRRRGGTTD
jgi:dihydrofolate reductase